MSLGYCGIDANLTVYFRPVKITIVYGTRPEAVKFSEVVKAFRAAGESPTIVCTNQHTDLLRGTPAETEVRPDVSLGLASSNDPLAYAGIVEGALRAKWARAKPDVVIVQGDTASAYAGAVAASALGIPVAHVEAGIRSGDTQDPFPEEQFRVAIDGIAKWRFAPTKYAFKQLLGWDAATAMEEWDYTCTPPRFDRHTSITGNPGIDALYSHTQPLQHPHKMQDRVLVTLHRRESFGTTLAQIVDGLLQAAQKYPGLEFLWPTHPNPNVQAAIPEFRQLPPNVQILAPMPTVPFARMLAASRCVLSDSGGVQEEAAALGVPCLVAREKTDRPESVAIGLARVVGRTPEGILSGLDWALGFQARCTPSDCFGDGHASPRIIEHLLNGAP